MSLVVASNRGSWTRDSIGVVGVLEDNQTLRTFCDDKMRDHSDGSVPPSREYCEDVPLILNQIDDMYLYVEGEIQDMIEFVDNDPDNNEVYSIFYILIDTDA